jgi:predicted RNA polymerase sigma factor
MLGRTAEAARAYTRAIALSEDAATREFRAGREEKIPRVLGSE